MTQGTRLHLVTAAALHTMDPRLDHSRALNALVHDGEHVVDIGDAGDLMRAHPGAIHTHHVGGVIVPGFNDAHQHLSDVAATLDHIDAGEPPLSMDKGALLAALTHAATGNHSEWVRAYRYDETRCSETILTRADLDAAVPHRPVLVTHISDHWAVMNSVGLKLAGLPADCERIESAELFRVAWSDHSVIAPGSPAEQIERMTRLAAHFSSAGITSIGDAFVSRSQVDTYRRAAAKGGLGLRVTMLVDAAAARAILAVDNLEWGDCWVRVGGFKGFIDGAVAAQSCLLNEPYENSHHRGELIADLAELARTFTFVHQSGHAMAVHANGDRALELLMDITEANGVQRGMGPRHRIEHCSVLTPALVERIAQSGMAVVPFGAYIAAHGHKLESWYGTERLERMFAHRWLLDAHIPTGGSSDYSASPYEPLYAIQSMVTRTAEHGACLGASQRITPYQALHVYTVGSARAAGEEHIKGSLTPGKLADYVVLDDDPLTVASTEIASIPVLHTALGAQVTWSARS